LLISLIAINCSFMQKTAQTNGAISITVDDVLNWIKINGKTITLNGQLSAYNVVKTIPVEFYFGDSIEINGTNGGGPQGIIATINWTENGQKNSISTGPAWTCGTQHPPTSMGANGVGPWGNMNGIDKTAQWIWNSNIQKAGDSTTCSLLVAHPANAKLYVTVDNTLNSIAIDGKSIPITGTTDVTDWTVVKTYSVSIYPGNSIEICGTNTGGPAGIIASFTYTDRKGKALTGQTGAGWMCGGKAAVLQGANGVGPWGSKPPIAATAQWIWNSLLQIAGDTTCCSYSVPKVGRCRKG